MSGDPSGVERLGAGRSAPGDRGRLRRVLGLGDATAVVVGAIVGVGIFFNPRDVARISGSVPAAMMAWCVGGAIALLGALTFAELARLRPVAGGQYHVLRDAFGRPAAFLFVFCNLTAVQTGGVAIISIVCAQNLGVALRGAPPSEPWMLGVAALLTWVVALVNGIGVRSGAGLQNATVALKLLAIAAVVAVAAALPPGARPASVAAPHPLTFPSLFAGVTLTLFAYGGWQQALWVAGEVRDADRTVPRAILLGVAIVVAVYLSVNWAYFRLLGLGGVREAHALAADAISVASPGPGRRLAAAAVAVSAFGVLNAQFLTGPRLTWAMACDGSFFPPFARLNRRFATPVAAIVLLAALATAMTLGLGLARTDLLTTGVVVVDAAFFALTGFALPVLQRREGGGRPWQGAAAIAFAVLELLAIAGSVLHQDVRIVALSALGWIGAAALTWALFFARATALR